MDHCTFDPSARMRLAFLSGRNGRVITQKGNIFPDVDLYKHFSPDWQMKCVSEIFVRALLEIRHIFLLIFINSNNHYICIRGIYFPLRYKSYLKYRVQRLIDRDIFAQVVSFGLMRNQSILKSLRRTVFAHTHAHGAFRPMLANANHAM